MHEQPCCEQCGRPLPAHAPGGLCPACLFGQAVAAASEFAPSPALTAGGPSPILRLGDYELLEKVAEGGMGVVYKARQLSLNRIVAVKLIQPARVGSTEMVLRFRAEAEAAASLHHPNIVAIHETGESEGQHYFSMDYIEGQNLAQVISDFSFQISDFLQVARWIKTLAEAVDYAHQQGILHRDLKPSNIIIDTAGEPHLTDFGLARRLAGDSTLTLTGQVFGSPSFIPPEQAGGRRQAVGAPSDVYGLGAVLYFALTGRPPFVGETVETMLVQVLQQEPVAPRLWNPGIRRDLETICLKCLEKEPQRRYPTAQALADDLGRFLERKPILARPVGPVGKTWRWCRRKPVIAGLSAALTLALLLGFGAVLGQWRQTQLAMVLAERREYADQIALAQNLITAKQFDRATEILNLPTTERYRSWEWGWLQRQCNEDLMTLTNAGSTFAVFSPDSRLLATGGFHTNRVTVWDLATGMPWRSFVAHAQNVAQAVFSPDGRQLATTGWFEPVVRIWDVATGGAVRQLPHPDGVYGLAYSADGSKFASAGHDGLVRVWDCAHWEREPRVSPRYGDELYCVEFSPDGQRVAYGGGYYRFANSLDTSVCIWDLATGATQALKGHTLPVMFTTWSPKGDLLASVAFDGQAKLWDPQTARELATLRAGGGQAALMSAAFSQNGQQLIAAGSDIPALTAYLEVFDVPSRRWLYELRGHSKMVLGVRLAPHGQVLASAAGDGIVKLWATEHPPTYLSLEGHDQTVWKVAFSTDGQLLATGSLDQTVRIWNTTNASLVQILPVNFPVVSLAFSPDNQRLVTVGPENSACVWRIGPGLRVGGLGDWRVPQRLRGHTGSVMALAWSPDNQWIASGSRDHQTILWKAATGELGRRLAGHTNAVLALAFSPRGDLLATGSQDRSIRLWDLRSGDCERTLAPLGGPVLALAFSPDNGLLAAGLEDGTARLWDARTWRPLHTLRVSVNGPSGLAFSPDGRRLATAGGGRWLGAGWAREGHIRLWDVVLGREILAFIAHTNAVYGIAFSPDGRQLATSSGDNTARLWTAFPWRSADYPGDPRGPIMGRVEEYKRHSWHPASQPAADPARRIVNIPFGDFNLPPAGIKTRPLLPLPPRDPQATADQLDLTTAYNVALNESWQPVINAHDVDRSLARLGHGLQTLGGVPFDVRGIIQLRRAAPDCEQFPERVRIAVGRTFRRLHALHATRWNVRDGLAIATFVLHYGDGTQAELAINYGQHLRQEDTTIEPKGDCSQAAVAWSDAPWGSPEPVGEAVTEMTGLQIPWTWATRLYRATFVNPHPEREVRDIEYVSKLTESAPFLVALTVE